MRMFAMGENEKGEQEISHKGNRPYATVASPPGPTGISFEGYLKGEPEEGFLYEPGKDAPLIIKGNTVIIEYIKNTPFYELFLKDIYRKNCLPPSAIPQTSFPLASGQSFNSKEWYVSEDGLKLKKISGIRHDNRSLILPDYILEHENRKYFLDVKGVGARTPLYGFSLPETGDAVHDAVQNTMLDKKSISTSRWASRFFNTGIVERWRTRARCSPVYTSELWFGTGPYGGHGTKESLDSVDVSLLANKDNPFSIEGFYICPVLFSITLPDFVKENASSIYWYRKYRGDWSQQFRLIPSNIRLYFHSDNSIGLNPRKILFMYGCDTLEKADAFIENFIRSGVACMTVGFRTLKPGVLKTPSGDVAGFELLDYDDVWLDKDSIVAADGTIHFADIDDLEWRFYPDEESVGKKIVRQFNRNFFEFMFGLDTLLTERYIMAGCELTAAERRRDVAARFEMALTGDNYVTSCHSLEHPDSTSSVSGLDLLIKSRILSKEVRIRLIDF
ncbi:MAG: hypothetical protein QW728_04880 [Thermoplasmata archaeon]